MADAPSAARVRINLAQQELEIIGSEVFVERWAERLELLILQLVRDVQVTSDPPLDDPEPASTDARQGAATRDADPGPFGAYVQRLPRDATETDRMLAAGWWLQRRSPDTAFATGEASRLLAEHGHRIGNPSQAVRQSLIAKRLFQLAKGRWRVADPGTLHLRRLTGDSQ